VNRSALVLSPTSGFPEVVDRQANGQDRSQHDEESLSNVLQ
jgi:hypothetical protein